MKEKWKTILQRDLVGKSEILKISGLTTEELNKIQEGFPVKINRKICHLQLSYDNFVGKQFLLGKIIFIQS